MALAGLFPLTSALLGHAVRSSGVPGKGWVNPFFVRYTASLVGMHACPPTKVVHALGSHLWRYCCPRSGVVGLMVLWNLLLGPALCFFMAADDSVYPYSVPTVLGLLERKPAKLPSPGSNYGSAPPTSPGSTSPRSAPPGGAIMKSAD